jgi:hypothetical protein
MTQGSVFGGGCFSESMGELIGITVGTENIDINKDTSMFSVPTVIPMNLPTDLEKQPPPETPGFAPAEPKE